MSEVWFRLTPEQERFWRAIERGEPIKLTPVRRVRLADAFRLARSVGDGEGEARND